MMKLSEINQHLIHQFKSEADLVEAIHTLSENFTLHREKISEYLNDPRLVSAYTSFYLSTNLPKLASVFEYIKKSFVDYKDYEVIDIGTGPGTFLLSFMEELPKGQFIGIETSKLMREQAKKLIDHFYPKAQYYLTDSFSSIAKKNKARLGIFSHSANEMEVSQVINYIKVLDLDEILFIEPGTKDFFLKSLSIREELLKREYKIHYPCPSQSVCPLAGQQQDWCHQFLKINLDNEVSRLCQLVKKDRSLLPLTIHYYQNLKPKTTEINRVVRTFSPSKFAIEMQICRNLDEKNQIIKIQQLTRNLKKAQIKKMAKIMSGQKIEFNPEKEIGDNFIRGEIDES